MKGYLTVCFETMILQIGIVIDIGKQLCTSYEKTVNSVLTSLDAAKKAAVATEKASTISASLNPASAAIAVAQKYVIEKVDQEIKESKDALNVAPKQIENYKGFTSETKEKLKKVESEQERKKQIKEERNIKLNS